jgi:beta-carotene hydroxylase
LADYDTLLAAFTLIRLAVPGATWPEISTQGLDMSSLSDLEVTANQTAARYMGEVCWPTVFLGTMIIVGYVAVLWAVATAGFTLWLAVPASAVLVYLGYTVLHESIHGSITGRDRSLRWLNDLLGYLMGQLLFIPMTAHRYEHLAHHRHTNNPEKDPDFAYSRATGPIAALLTVPKGITTQYRFFFRNCWNAGRRAENAKFVIEVCVALAWRLAFMMQGYWLEGLAIFVLGALLGLLLLMYLFAFIVHQPYREQGRYVDTATIVIPGPFGKLINLLWMYQNYHSIHHLYPRVPFYRYVELFEEIEPIMSANGAQIHELGPTGLRPATT